MIEKYNEDDACDSLRMFWLEFAEVCKNNAMEATTPARSIEWASVVEGALWRATGNESGLSFDEIIENGKNDD